jgi:hypothetical protein
VHEGGDAHVVHPAVEAAGCEAGARACSRSQPPRAAARRCIHRRRTLAPLRNIPTCYQLTASGLRSGLSNQRSRVQIPGVGSRGFCDEQLHLLTCRGCLYYYQCNFWCDCGKKKQKKLRIPITIT